MTPPRSDKRQPTAHVVTTPSHESWLRLCGALIQAAHTERYGHEYEGAPAGFMAAESAVDAILVYLQGCDGLMQAGAIAPVLRLRSALRDLQEGRQPDLLRPRSRGGRPDTDHRKAAVIGLAARAMTELIASGLPVTAAAGKVCDAMRSGRAIGWQSVKPTTIRNWRSRCEEGPGADIAPEAIRHYREPLPPGMGDTPGVRANNLLAVLSEATRRGFGE